jgi:predicted peroxiredoxin
MEGLNIISKERKTRREKKGITRLDSCFDELSQAGVQKGLQLLLCDLEHSVHHELSA